MRDSGNRRQGLGEARLPSLDGDPEPLRVQEKEREELPRRRNAGKVWKRLRPEFEKLP